MASDKKSSWKEYYSRPEVKARILANKKKYRSRPEVKEREKEYRKKYAQEHPDYWRDRANNNREHYNEVNRLYHNAHKEYGLKYRLEHLNKYAEYARTYRAGNEDVVLAQRAVRLGIKKGTIQKQPCSNCGESQAEAHHDDYSRPLDIRWLCKKCHMEWHRQNKAKH